MMIFISFDSRRQSSPSDEKRRGTSQVLRDKTLQMLAPDLIENDPLVCKHLYLKKNDLS